MNNSMNNTPHVSAASTGGITEQQLKAVLSNLVNSRVVQVCLFCWDYSELSEYYCVPEL